MPPRSSSPRERAEGPELSPVLQAAAEELISRSEAPERIAGIVERVVRAVERTRTGADPSLDAGSLEHPHLHHRVLEELRCRILLREPSQGPGEPCLDDPAETLSVVSAMERVRLRIWEGEEGEELARRLSEPGAFDLLVEVAHDLRSPLSSILFLSETLRSGHSGEVSDLQKSQLGLIYSAALGMVSIASDVVELARGGRAYGEEEPEPFSVRKILRSVREMVRPMAEEKDVELVIRSPRSDRVLGHPVLLTRVLLNLVTNGLKFTEEGIVTVEAERIDRTTIEFSVADTGPGLDEEKRASLFRPFKESKGRDGHFFSGSGLGLSIVRRLVRAMGSELELESEPGEGTTFRFRIEMPPDASLRS